MDKANGACLQSYRGHVNTEYRIRSCLGLRDAVVISGSEEGEKVGGEGGEGGGGGGGKGGGGIWAWDLLTGEVVDRLFATDSFGSDSFGSGAERERESVKKQNQKSKIKNNKKNIISAVAFNGNESGGSGWASAGMDGECCFYFKLQVQS